MMTRRRRDFIFPMSSNSLVVMTLCLRASAILSSAWAGIRPVLTAARSLVSTASLTTAHCSACSRTFSGSSARCRHINTRGQAIARFSRRQHQLRHLMAEFIRRRGEWLAQGKYQKSQAAAPRQRVRENYPAGHRMPAACDKAHPASTSAATADPLRGGRHP